MHCFMGSSAVGLASAAAFCQAAGRGNEHGTDPEVDIEGAGMEATAPMTDPPMPHTGAVASAQAAASSRSPELILSAQVSAASSVIAEKHVGIVVPASMPIVLSLQPTG